MWWQTDYRSEYNAYLIRVSIDNIWKFCIIIIERKNTDSSDFSKIFLFPNQPAKFEYSIPSGLGTDETTGSTTTFAHNDLDRGYSWDSSYSGNYRKAGKELRRELVHLHRPLYTNEITLSKLIFSASPNGYNWIDGANRDYLYPELGHDLKIQLELYGCSNYNIEQSKLKIMIDIQCPFKI